MPHTNPSPTAATDAVAGAITLRCPHCGSRVDAAVRSIAVPLRDLPAGRRRGRGPSPEQATRVTFGTTAGVLASAAQRADGPLVDLALVSRALREVARELGVKVGRLRMVDDDSPPVARTRGLRWPACCRRRARGRRPAPPRPAPPAPAPEPAVGRGPARHRGS